MSFRTHNVGLCYGVGEKTSPILLIVNVWAYKFSPHSTLNPSQVRRNDMFFV